MIENALNPKQLAARSANCPYVNEISLDGSLIAARSSASSMSLTENIDTPESA